MANLGNRGSVAAKVALVVLAACAAPQHVGRAPMVPPLQSADVEREAPVRADADRSPPVTTERPEYFVETPPTFRTVVHVVETPVYADEPVAEGSVPYADVEYYRYADHRHRHWRGPFFPVNTAVGAGIGAIIGHQSRHRGRGALIGGSVGLMLDLARWWR